MKITLAKGLKPAETARALARLKALLPEASVKADGRTVEVMSDAPWIFGERLALVENVPGVEAADLPLSEACPLALQAPPPELPFKTSSNFMVIAGPCAIESPSFFLAAARQLRKLGVSGLRAAAFKPRTSPYAFQGAGKSCFAAIRRARAATGLPAVTEATSELQLAPLARVTDVIQIGARNMRNYELLKAAAACGKPVLLKRAPGAALREWLLSAEYLLKHGDGRVILCERGDAYSGSRGRGLNIPLLKEALKTVSLPVIADPSHAAGRRELVPAQALAAVRAGADGLMIEVSADPASALVDGRQTLSIPDFEKLLKDIKRLRG